MFLSEMIPTSKEAFVSFFCDLMLRIYVTKRDRQIQVCSLNQPVEINAFSGWKMTYVRSSAFDNHLYHSFIVFKEQHMFTIAWVVASSEERDGWRKIATPLSLNRTWERRVDCSVRPYLVNCVMTLGHFLFDNTKKIPKRLYSSSIV